MGNSDLFTFVCWLCTQLHSRRWFALNFILRNGVTYHSHHSSVSKVPPTGADKDLASPTANQWRDCSSCTNQLVGDAGDTSVDGQAAQAASLWVPSEPWWMSVCVW